MGPQDQQAEASHDSRVFPIIAATALALVIGMAAAVTVARSFALGKCCLADS